MEQETPPPTPSSSGDTVSDRRALYAHFRYEKGQQIAHRFYVHERASGGWGHVYLCYDQAHDYFYALKMLKLSQRVLEDPNTHQRLAHEVNTWIALGEHAHIVQCYTLETFDALPFLVLEWVADSDILSRLYRFHHRHGPHFLDWYARLGRRGLPLRRLQATANREGAGTSLASWIHRQKQLAPALALQIAQDVCAGLAHAQQVFPGFVHRDLKPANVLLTEQLRAKVTDFGTAIIAQDLLAPGRLSGTAPYRAPEQWRGEALDIRTDIYALGCLLYEMLTGRSPFTSSAGDEAQLRWRHLHAPPPALHGRVPSPLDEIVQTCLQKEPAARFASLGELAGALAAAEATVAERPRAFLAAAQPPTVEELNQVAVAHYTLGQYTAALATLERAIALDSSYPNSYTNRGCVYHMLGQHPQAREDYTQAIRLGHRAINAKVRNNRALLYLVMGQPDRALGDVQQALATEPDYANAHVTQGLAYFQQGHPQQAVTSFGRALALNPKHVLAHHNRGYVSHVLGELEAAAADYTAALEHAPAFLPARLNRLALYRQLGRHAQVEQEARQLARLHPALKLDREHLEPSLQLSRPDPQLVNAGSLAALLERPFRQWHLNQLVLEETFGLAAEPQGRMPLQAVATVVEVAYSDWLHDHVLARQQQGERITQLTAKVKLQAWPRAGQAWAGIRECSLVLDEEAMRQMAAAGLRTLAALRGRWLTLRNDHPDDIHHPLRIEAIH